MTSLHATTLAWCSERAPRQTCAQAVSGYSAVDQGKRAFLGNPEIMRD
jgi:hypothetical protein